MVACTRRIAAVSLDIQATSLHADRADHAAWCRPSPHALRFRIKPLAVPDAEHRRLALVAEHRDGSRVEAEQAAVASVEAEPARGQHPQRMAVAEEQRVASRRPSPCQDAVRALGNVLGRLSTGGRVRPDGPSRDGLANLRRADPLVASVVPFDEVVVDQGIREAGELGSLPCPCAGLVRTSENDRPARRSPISRAASTPRWVRGTSVTDVWRQSRLQAVSP